MRLRPSRPAPLALAALLLLVLAWSGGFLWFVHVAGEGAARPPQADGILVLTGGADRVETGLRLLQEGRGRVLLVSGVERGTGLAVLARLARLDPGPLAARVTLGHMAESTHGNAAEAVPWARRNNIHSLLVVTAGYHMPRALAELSTTLPDVTLTPVPVVPPALRRGETFATLRLLAEEYMKWLAVETGFSRLVPPREAALATRAWHG